MTGPSQTLSSTSSALRWIGRLGVLGLIALGVLYWKFIISEPGDHISPQAINQIISRESPVYYRDGETKVGVFFSREHRVYVPFSEIPKSCVDALIAAEDERFYSHPGVDPFGIARAMLANLKARRLVAGGSTLTQQTAKNLYYRPDRSLKSKWAELLNALRLEAYYSKDEILEFYFNQFHVAGNGRGLGIAARYYFDKPVRDLNVQECAFIAGSVKAPARYNPFIGRSEASRLKAKESAQNRTSYVLRRMFETGRLSSQEYDVLRDSELPFKRGEFRFKPSTTLDAVESRLARPPFPELFEHLGIEDPLNSGLQIITTLDADAQRWAQYGLRHHLSEVGSYLEKLSPKDLIETGARPPVESPAETIQVGNLFRGNVVKVKGKGKSRLAYADLGGGVICLIDHDAVERSARQIKRAKLSQPWSNTKTQDLNALWKALTPSEESLIVELSVREVFEDGSDPRCDLEFAPMLEGAILMMEGGRVRAMAGGAKNRYFNRATDARRQFGSIWKLLVYEAALELGWTLGELIDNRINAFPFEGSWYYPRPDHEPAPFVDMSEAGTKSENLASVWLLYHLVDKLHPHRLEHLARRLDMVPREDEDEKAYLVRMRDRWGVIDTDRQRGAVAFEWARQKLVTELELRGRARDALEVSSLHYGTGFEAEWRRVAADRSLTAESKEARLGALKRNFLYLHRQIPQCRELYEHERRSLLESLINPTTFESDMEILIRENEGELELACASRVWDGWSRLQDFEGPSLSPREISFSDLRVEGTLSIEALALAERWVSEGFDWAEQTKPYSLRRLIYHPDYRRLLAMLHIGKLAKSLGVASELKPILAMPLGATDLTLSEAVVMYRGLITGETMRVRGKVVANDEGWEPSSGNTTESFYTLIDEIRDSEGNVLYQTTMEKYPVVDEGTRGNVFAILRSVVQNGTGRRVSNILSPEGVVWPLAGKTGTSNAYRNATFLGVVPRWGPEDWTLDQGWIVGAYVGYDNNKPMKRRGLRVSGANGALPIWKTGVEGIIQEGLVGNPPEGHMPFVPEGFEERAYGPAIEGKAPNFRLMPIVDAASFRPHAPPPIEWAPLEVTTSLEAEVDGLVEAAHSSEAPVDGSLPEEEFNKSDEDLMEVGDGSQERKALEEALSSLAGKLRGRQEERRDVEGRYGWLRTSTRSQDATEWTAVTRRLAAEQALVFEKSADAFEILYRSKREELLSPAEERLWPDVVDAFVLEEVQAFSSVLRESSKVEEVAGILESMLELDAFVGPNHPWLTELQGYALARWEFLEAAGSASDAAPVPTQKEPATPTDVPPEASEDEGGILGGLRQLFKRLGAGSEASP